MNVALAIAALAVSAFAAFSFWKAGSFKATASRDTLLGAGFGWIEPLPIGVVRLIAWLELLGAIGIVLAPLAAYFVPGFGWAILVGVAAAAGLASTMLVAAIVHIARGEFKYTWKMNTSLFAASVIAAVLLSLVDVPLIG
ncbi:MAG: DoxX family protein [Aquiluna sp.]|nr:DoxX family protein [Aquiluna sp.]